MYLAGIAGAGGSGGEGGDTVTGTVGDGGAAGEGGEGKVPGKDGNEGASGTKLPGGTGEISKHLHVYNNLITGTGQGRSRGCPWHQGSRWNR